MKPPKSKLDYRSDKESTIHAAGSRFLVATDTEGMPNTQSIFGSSTQKPTPPRYTPNQKL